MFLFYFVDFHHNSMNNYCDYFFNVACLAPSKRLPEILKLETDHVIVSNKTTLHSCGSFDLFDTAVKKNKKERESTLVDRWARQR